MSPLNWLCVWVLGCFLLRRALALPFWRSMSQSKTIRPQFYPELEREVYLSLEPATERETLLPSPAEAEALAAESRRGL